MSARKLNTEEALKISLRQQKELIELLEQSVAASEDPPFVPNQFQVDILDALKGKALRTDALGAKVRDRRRLFRDPGSLPELIEEGMVAHHKRLGYYRPDAPPPELAQLKDG